MFLIGAGRGAAAVFEAPALIAGFRGYRNDGSCVSMSAVVMLTLVLVELADQINCVDVAGSRTGANDIRGDDDGEVGLPGTLCRRSVRYCAKRTGMRRLQ